MRILITGSAGFIGYHLSKLLVNDGYEVLGIDNINNYYDVSLKKDRLKKLINLKNFKFIESDINDRNKLSEVFKSFSPNKVVNLAAQPGVRYSLKNPYAYIDSNVSGFLNVIELCKINEVEGFVYASSSSVYGNQKSSHSKIDKPISLYGATKRSNELIAYSYSHLYGMNTTGLRYFTVYGTWYRPDMAIYIFTKNIIDGIPITVFNNGKMRRDFTYVDDIVLGTKSAIEKNYKYEIFNLGNNKSEKLMDVISLIEKSLGKKAVINFQPIQPGDVYETCADINHSKKINFSPKTDIKVGVPIFINWYKNYYNVKD